MALQTKTISAWGSKGHHNFHLDVIEDSTSIANNTSSISYKLRLDATSWNWELWGTKISYTIVIGSHTITGYIPDIPKNQAFTIKTDSGLSIGHNTDGSKAINISFSIYDGANQYYTSGNASASDTMYLTNIPRYANITSFIVEKIDETSVKFKYTLDAGSDWSWYSKDNGNTWETLYAYGESNYIAGIVTGLNPNTTYNFKVRVKRTDSQLTTDSGTYTQTTYDYPKPTSLAHFTIGDGVVVDVSNPLGRWYRVELISKETWAVIASSEGTYNGGVTLGKTENEINLQYMSIPDKQVGGYYARVLYGNIERTLDWGGTYKIRGNEAPTVGSISYKDSNSETTEITENDQRIIRNNSNLLFTVGTATGNNYASISKYEIEFSGTKKSRTTMQIFN